MREVKAVIHDTINTIYTNKENNSTTKKNCPRLRKINSAKKKQINSFPFTSNSIQSKFNSPPFFQRPTYTHYFTNTT